jgi:hypothetical protein
VLPDSPNQVNLPDKIVANLDSDLRYFMRQSSESDALLSGPSSSSPSSSSYGQTAKSASKQPGADKSFSPPQSTELTDLFVPAQKNIFNLMDSDSYPRFKRSQEYRTFVDEWQKLKRQREVYEEEGIL